MHAQARMRVYTRFSLVDHDLVRTRARRPRNERYFSKQKFVQNQKCIQFLVYVALLFVCGANNNRPNHLNHLNHLNRSTLSFPMTEQEVHMLALVLIELT
jgi:hypothetical protein